MYNLIVMVIVSPSLLGLSRDSSASENSCIMSEKIKPGDVIMMSSGLSQREHGDHKFIAVRACGKAELWSSKDVGVYKEEEVLKISITLHSGKCRTRQFFGA